MSRAAETELDLVTRQATVSLWSLGGSAHRHLYHCAEFVAKELELMERVSHQELVDASYLAEPRSEELESFRGTTSKIFADCPTRRSWS